MIGGQSAGKGLEVDLTRAPCQAVRLQTEGPAAAAAAAAVAAAAAAAVVAVAVVAAAAP